MTKQKSPPPDPDLLARLWHNIVLAGQLMFDGRVSGTAKMIPVVVLAYILSPYDLIPDVFVPLGIVDDLAALVVGLQLFIHSAPPEVVHEYRSGKRRPKTRRQEDQPPPEESRPGSFQPDETKVIEGHYSVKEDESQEG